MRLVLLPGMDGTGRLFEGFLSFYKGDLEVISLPPECCKDYFSISEVISKQLPESGFVLLAESFSGGLVQYLISEHRAKIKGVIFVSSFISPPSILALRLAALLPIVRMATLPGATFFHRFLFLGFKASIEDVNQFVSVVRKVPEKTLKARLSCMYVMKPLDVKIDVPCLYIQPDADRLVSKNKAEEISNVCRELQTVIIDGPHFILQAQPKESAEHIQRFISSLR